MLSTIAAVLTHVRTLPQQFHLSRCNIENGIRINDYKRIKFILTLCWFLIFVLIRFWCYAAVFVCVCLSHHINVRTTIIITIIIINNKSMQVYFQLYESNQTKNDDDEDEEKWKQKSELSGISNISSSSSSSRNA